ncbi:hypothetical protein BGX38DRAFT_1229646, partial [Terfezia claveryi]
MPKSRKGKGQKAGASWEHLVPPNTKTPEPEQRQRATPLATPMAAKQALEPTSRVGGRRPGLMEGLRRMEIEKEQRKVHTNIVP